MRRGTALRIVYAVVDRAEEGRFWPRPPSGSTNATSVLLVETSAVEGGAVATLAAGSEGVAVTVVGTRGLGSVTGLLAGSVSRRLAARVHGPLVVARGSHSLRKAARGAARPGGAMPTRPQPLTPSRRRHVAGPAARPALSDAPAHHPRTAVADCRGKSRPGAPGPPRPGGRSRPTVQHHLAARGWRPPAARSAPVRPML
ncbi:universal stress protein [Streptomyces fragilis]|uniref:Universal stress protein n=1 Tax=Streptomyces fragilis TaxID=67301 RepID=A0ABV2YRA8_9ACTN|nr:universal stress protein [Streptomyces fragilis]